MADKTKEISGDAVESLHLNPRGKARKPTQALARESTRSKKRGKATSSQKAIDAESSHTQRQDDGGEGNAVQEGKGGRDRSAIVNAIILTARRRQTGIKSTTALTNQRLAVIRSALGFQTKDEEQSRQEMVAASRAVDDAIRKGKVADLDPEYHEVANRVTIYCTASYAAEAQFAEQIIKPCEKELNALMQQLPEWEQIGAVRGIGTILIADIIGTVGDIASYKGPRSLRKMLGVAPHNGKALSTWKKKGGLSASEWVEVRSNPNRFVYAYRLADAQIKARGGYRPIYDERKVIEAARTGDDGKPVTPMIAHRRAMRKMASAMLNDIWAMSRGMKPKYLPDAVQPL